VVEVERHHADPWGGGREVEVEQHRVDPERVRDSRVGRW
jgi:hypothetical protein